MNQVLKSKLWIFILSLQMIGNLLSKEIQFQHLTIEDGLSHSKINSIQQDYLGFMWFGTNDGLNCYDGYKVKEYQYDLNDSTSLGHTIIRYIYEDRKGRLWIAIDAGGLHLFDRENDCFIRFLHDPDDTNSICSNNINFMIEDRLGHLWIATRHGLDCYDPDQGRFHHYLPLSENSPELSRFYIRTLCFDNQQNLWIGTDNIGLVMLKPDHKTFIHFKDESSKIKILGELNIMSFCFDEKEHLWIGSNSLGVFKLDPKHQQLIHFSKEYQMDMPSVRAIVELANKEIWIGCILGLYTFNQESHELKLSVHSDVNPKSLTHQSVLSIYQDQAEHTWLGTRKGINFYNKNFNVFNHHSSVPGNQEFINNKVVYALCEELNGDIWVGTENGGLNCLHQKTGLVSCYQHDPENRNSLSSNYIKSMKMDHLGNLWIGTFSGGLNCLNRQRNRFTRYLHDPSNSNSLPNNVIYSIEEDDDGNIWSATLFGVSRFNPETGQFDNFQRIDHDSTSLSHNDCKMVYQDRNGTIWVATFDGLNRFVPETESFVHYFHDPNDSTSLENNYIQVLFEDSQNRFWVGTQGGGLNLLNRKNGKCKAFTKNEGLPSNSIYGIVEDARGSLWCSSNKGIFQFDPDNNTIIAFDASDGLQSNQFTSNAFFKTSDGYLLFGGINGFNYFHPDEIRKETYIPPVVFTDFKLFNQSMKVNKPGSPLTKHISLMDTLVLSYKQSIFTLEFAALNYVASQKNQYAHMLEGFEDKWNEVGTQRSVTYTNLPPDKYVFKVKGSNNHGVWNENPASLVIIIKPPYYKTFWFKAFLFLCIIISMVVIYRIRVKSIEERKNELEDIHQKLNREAIQQEKAEKRIQKQLTEKELLIKEIHHRVKNNLQLIISLLRLQAINVTDGKMLALLQDSRERIQTMALVHERLYRTKNLADIDFGEYIKNLIAELSNSYRMESRKIIFDVECESVLVQIDFAVPCGLILNELITNCMKHAFPENWEKDKILRIAFYRSDSKTVHLEIEDNGQGFNYKKNFNNIESLGLKLIQILVEDQLDGQMNVDYHEGTLFHIIFPL